jgi:CheY-like chemotaxis protein/anti-sigma regulatory factor (Ser/Thr protein kinase)
MLGYNGIGALGIEALGNHVALEKLGVAGNGIPESGAKILAKNKRITWLDLSYNQIDDIGTEALGDNTTLEYLNISYNYVYAEGAQYLVKHPKLHTLILSYNTIGDSGLEPFKSLPDEELLLKGDDYRFKQIVLNLLGNAIKFTHNGFIQVGLTVQEQSAQQTQLELKVKDTGIGMTTEEVSHLFQRFSQANLSVGSHYGGSGLGLFIAQRLAQLMDGQIQVKSTQGKGTTFICDVRLEQVVKTQSEQADVHSRLIPVSTLKYRVLIVDDNIINQKVLKSLIERAGHTCLLAKDGHEAIAFYEKQVPDVIFMDTLMPKMNGLEATLAIRRLEKQHQRREVPIVALSGNAQAQDKKEALEAGMNDYLTKPFKREQIYQKITDLCQDIPQESIEEQTQALSL